MKFVLALAIAVFGLAGSAQAQTKVTFGLTGAGFINLPFYIAQEKGYFKDEGITVDSQILKGAPLTVQAAISGDIDVAVAPSISTVIQSQVSRSDVKIFGLLVNQMVNALVVRGDLMDKAGVTSASPLADRLKLLKGLKLAVTSSGSLSDGITRYFVSAAGLNPDRDVTIVVGGDNDTMLAAMAASRIDGFVLSSPTIELAEQQDHAKILVNLIGGEVPKFKGFPFSTLAATQAWLQKNGETAKRIDVAIQRAEDLIQKDPDQAKAAVKSDFNFMSPAVFDEAFKNNVAGYPATPRIDPAGIQTGIEVTAMTQGSTPPVKAEDLYTNAYAP